MILNQRNDAPDRALEVARAMASAARTAPKSRGNDLLEVIVLTGDDIKGLSEAMYSLYGETGRPVFERDSKNILSAHAVVIIGIGRDTMGLNCGHCGYETCLKKPERVPCAFNGIDLGIAVGSACATAADYRVDTRVMYSAGMGAQRLELLPGCVMIHAIPVSISSKNPFFDRG